MTKAESTTLATETIELAPSYKIPLFLVLTAIPLSTIQVWLGLVIAILGLFLFIQTITIRLVFTPTALEVYRSRQMIRQFPYADWLAWRIFWQPVPILFYFREIKSIHFLPIIFAPKTLVSCLEKYCPTET